MTRYLKENYTFSPECPQIGIWKIEESEEELLALLPNASDIVADLETLHGSQRRKEWLSTRVLLQQMLNQPARISYHENGAPYLKDNPLHISISHTKGYAAVLLQTCPNAGIDLEYRSDRILKIRSRFISPEEEKNIDPAHETDSLLLHWCAKEALFKMIGCSEVDFTKHLHVLPHQFGESGFITVKETKTQACKSYRLAYQLEDDFVIVWSSPLATFKR